MVHLDLFSGIGGFAYAADQVFGDVTHIFCDNDNFCKQVLKKHWPESEIYDDIRSITADSYISRYIHGQPQKLPAERHDQAQREPEPSSESPDVLTNPPSAGLERQTGSGLQRREPGLAIGVDLLTGGFPCQPFSAAGLRKGTADERHLWPEMLRVIRLTKPSWVIAENVRGLLNWNEGVVFEQVCTDLESEGYEVQPFIIPAVAVNAPHRRDRIWFVAHRISRGHGGGESEPQSRDDQQPIHYTQEKQDSYDLRSQTGGRSRGNPNVTNTRYQRQAFQEQQTAGDEQYSWNSNWLEVAAELCRVDDGLPARLDGFELTKSAHRKERLKSLGNAIVPQVAMEIMIALKKRETK